MRLGCGGNMAAAKSKAYSTGIWAFHAESTDDIINVASPLPGHQYFQSGGNTLRQGMEAAASVKWARWSVYANYTRVDATFRSVLVLSSPNNPFADLRRSRRSYSGGAELSVQGRS